MHDAQRNTDVDVPSGRRPIAYIRASWALMADDPFRRASVLYLATIGLVGAYTLVFIALGEQPASLRAAGAASLLLLAWTWLRTHQDDDDAMWLAPFEAVGLFTVGMAAGSVLRILGLFYVSLYFRSLRGGARRALLRATVFAIAYLSLFVALSPLPRIESSELFISMTIAFPLVAITNALLGAGLRDSRRHQAELARAHEEIRTSHRRLTDAERIAGVGSWEWDPETGAMRVSEGLQAIAGILDRSDIVRDWPALVHPDDRTRVAVVADRVASGAWPAVDAEYRLIRPDGSVRYVLSRAKHVADDGGARSAAVGTVHDITDLRELGSELTRQQELSEMKSRFLSTVSHELRTPLTSLVGFTETMLADDYDRPTRREFLMLMQQQGAELQALIEDLITFGRVEAGELTLERRVVNLRDEVARVVDGLRSRAEGVVIEIAGDIELWGDPLRVRQIVRNLLDNAYKYGTSPVTVSASRNDQLIVCRVSDVGSGVHPAHAEAIFEPYRRLVDDRTMSQPGVGLGLPLSRLLAERQGGHLRYAGGELGATFEFALPAA